MTIDESQFQTCWKRGGKEAEPKVLCSLSPIFKFHPSLFAIKRNPAARLRSIQIRVRFKQTTLAFAFCYCFFGLFMEVIVWSSLIWLLQTGRNWREEQDPWREVAQEEKLGRRTEARSRFQTAARRHWHRRRSQRPGSTIPSSPAGFRSLDRLRVSPYDLPSGDFVYGPISWLLEVTVSLCWLFCTWMFCR